MKYHFSDYIPFVRKFKMTSSSKEVICFVVCLCFITLLFLLQGDEETFENYYRKQRKKQARLVLQPQSNMVSI